MRRLALVAVLFTALFGWLAPAASAAPADVSACAGTVQITRLAFTSATVVRGQTATLLLAARNCTVRTVATTLTETARYVSSSPGVPPGCPVIDPLPRQVSFAPLGRFTDSVDYRTFLSCAATGLRATATFTGRDGTILAQASALVTITDM